MNKRKPVYAKNHQERFGVEKRTKNDSGAELFANIATLDELCRSADLQLKLYLTGDLPLIRNFFEEGGCFLQKVQRQITNDNNIEMLDLFLRYWEYIPTERSYMIKQASMEFIEHYLAAKSLGTQGEDFARNARFPKEFVARYAHLLNAKAKAICRGFRKIEVE
ncbi:MAG: hypothetical protein MR368_06485 [Azospirillum sp.]|nr:hypothetical protein [Azospirillum sp.]